MFLRKNFFLVLLFALTFNNAIAAEKFVIKDIILKGLQRVDPGTIYTYLPFEIGDVFDSSTTPQIIKSLFKSKFFDDIVIEREGSTLVFYFDERPTIIDIDFEGLEDIEPEQLDKILDAANI